MDVSGTGITGVIQGGATGDGTSTANLTLVGDSSVNTNGDLTITTVTDANGNADSLAQRNNVHWRKHDYECCSRRFDLCNKWQLNS